MSGEPFALGTFSAADGVPFAGLVVDGRCSTCARFSATAVTTHALFADWDASLERLRASPRGRSSGARPLAELRPRPPGAAVRADLLRRGELLPPPAPDRLHDGQERRGRDALGRGAAAEAEDNGAATGRPRRAVRLLGPAERAVRRARRRRAVGPRRRARLGARAGRRHRPPRPRRRAEEARSSTSPATRSATTSARATSWTAPTSR